MNLMQVVPDTTMMVSGYEHHTLQCSACPEVEQRLVFRQNAPQPAESVPVHSAPPVSPAFALASERGATASAWKRAFARLRHMNRGS
jgi:hypothetical protein